MPPRNETVPRTTAPAPPGVSPLQLCLAAAAKDDEMAMEFLPRRGRATYIAVRLNRLTALEVEHGERLERMPFTTAPSGRWA